MIVAGFGCRAGASAVSLRAALDRAQRGVPPITLLAAPHDKLPALAPLAATLGLPITGIAPDALTVIVTPTQSTASLMARGVGSLCEAAALAAAGPGATLIGRRVMSPDRMATCAIAQGQTP
ncbi:cobalamin biosynthesis protein [Sphingobium sp. HBC34]|uniref:Cobalamin biosynthesis protein n=1 Tax=Sphingobium cyanobacteriorum TaxID=3063954 RepID=A0ABT8ZSG3_9SPHN|nr:cobalamin biosynthesis protein [Sphingobium sp. HBC34]MDO7836665.1 cobalamin biosynthesis protein [Sphingobium sp. HBC34]